MSLLDIFRISKIKNENSILQKMSSQLNEENQQLKSQLDYLGYPNVTKTQQMLTECQQSLTTATAQLDALTTSISERNN